MFYVAQAFCAVAIMGSGVALILMDHWYEGAFLIIVSVHAIPDGPKE